MRRIKHTLINSLIQCLEPLKHQNALMAVKHIKRRPIIVKLSNNKYTTNSSITKV